MTKILLALLILGWSLFVTISWLSSHYEQFLSLFGLSEGSVVVINMILPFFALCLIVFLLYIYLFVRNRSTQYTLNISPLTLGILFFVLTLFVFNISGFIRIIFGLTDPILLGYPWLLGNIGFITKAFLQFFWISTFLIGAYLLGQKIRLFFAPQFQPHNTLQKSTLDITLGFWGWSTILFLLGITHMLYAWVIAFFFAFLLLSKRKTLFHILQKTFQKHTLPIHFHTMSFWLSLLIALFFAVTFVDILHNEPKGFDDTTEYLNRAQLMSDTHTLIPGSRPFAFSLLATPSYLFHGDAFFAIGNNFAYAIIGCIALYGFALWLFHKKSYALLAATTWLVLPTTSEFLYREIKIELLLFAITTVATWLFSQWFLAKKRSDLPLYFAILLLGFAFSLKVTTAFLITPVAIIILIAFTRQYSLKKICKKLFLLLSIALVPLVLWIAYVPYTGGLLIPQNKNDILVNYNRENPPVREQLEHIGIVTELCVNTTLQEDLGRYSANYSSVFDYTLLRAWSLSMNDNPLVRTNATDIGFAFLLFGGLASMIFIALLIFQKINRTVLFFTFLGGTYWILWSFIGYNVIWYGYPGFLFLALLIPAVLVTLPQTYHLHKKILLGFAAANIVILLLVRIAFSGHPFIFFYITKGVDHFGDQFTPFYMLMNTEENQNTKIYTTATSAFYYVKNNDKRILKDYYLDHFTCMHDPKNPSQTLQHLKNLDVDYLFYSKNIPLMEKDPQGTLHTKTNQFLLFAESHLTLVQDQPEYLLFSLP